MDNIINLVRNKKIIVIGLGQQGKKIINFLIGEGLKENIIGICKTIKTKNNIETEFNIKVNLDYKYVLKQHKNNISFIFIGVNPLTIQEEIYTYIYNNFPKEKILIEKSFIRNEKKIEKISKLNFKHAIIKNELYTYPFFQKIIKEKTFKIQDILNIQMKIKVNNNIYNNIITGKVFFLSYIFDYIYFLEFNNITLEQINVTNNGYIINILIDGKKITVILSKLENSTITDNTIIYNLKENKNKFIFNNNTRYSIINNQKIENYPYKMKNYFFIFLKNKITLLLSNKTNLKSESDYVIFFRKINENFSKKFINFFLNFKSTT